MSESGFVRQAWLDAINDAFEVDIDPVQLLVAGALFDVKSLTVANLAAQIMDGSDTILVAQLRDGRELTLLASKIDGFVTGRAWE